MYCRGIERLQASVTLKNFMYFFTYTDTDKWARRIFAYNCRTQSPMKPIKLPKNLGINMKNTRMMQVKHSVLVLKWKWNTNYVSVYKLDRLTSGKPKATKLNKLPRRASNFALAKYEEKRVYLSGGDGAALRGVDYLDLETYKWHEAPSMN